MNVRVDHRHYLYIFVGQWDIGRLGSYVRLEWVIMWSKTLCPMHDPWLGNSNAGVSPLCLFSLTVKSAFSQFEVDVGFLPPKRCRLQSSHLLRQLNLQSPRPLRAKLVHGRQVEEKRMRGPAGVYQTLEQVFALRHDVSPATQDRHHVAAARTHLL